MKLRAESWWHFHIIRVNQNHVRFMALSWEFHSSFMALPQHGHTLPKTIEKKVHKIGFGCRFVCLLDFKFLFCNMSDLRWFHGSTSVFFAAKIQINNYIHLRKNYLTWMSESSHIAVPSWQINDIFASMSDSSRIHVTITAVLSLQSCHAQVRYSHVIFMGLFLCHLTALGWQIQTWPKGKVPWKCHEPAIKVTWNYLASHVRGCSQRAINVPWKHHDSAMNLP